MFFACVKQPSLFFFEKFSKMNIDGESFISVMNDNNRNMYMKCIV